MAFLHHVAWLSTIQAELVLEVLDFLLLGMFLKFLGCDCIDFILCSGGMIFVPPLRSTGSSSEGRDAV